VLTAENHQTADSPKNLIDWARKYFEDNKEVLKLLGISSEDELRIRILDTAKHFHNKKSQV
jgi:hypothetical protein